MVKSLRDELHLKTDLFEREINQVRQNNQFEIENADNRFREEYDSRLLNEIRLIRDEGERKMSHYKKEIEDFYKSERRDLEMNFKRVESITNQLNEELNDFKIKFGELQIENVSLKARNDQDKEKLRELTDKLNGINQHHGAEKQEKDRQLNNARKDIESLFLKYQELMEVKVSLEMEIKTYRQLLETEERRLHITPNSMSTPESNLNVSESQINRRLFSPPQMASSYIDSEASETSATRNSKKKEIRVGKRRN